MPKIPDNVTSTELEPYITTLEEMPVGYNFNEKDLAKYNFSKEKLSFIIVDELKSALPSLNGLFNVMCKVPGVKVRVIDFSGMYKQDNLDIKTFNSDYDALITAFEKDLKERTLQQDRAITIILGAGLMKQKLGDFGKEKLSEFFDAIKEATNSNVILIDAYERLKNLKVEKWYQTVNMSHGIWIGKGLENQNMLNVKALTMDERKLEFEGMAFLIDDTDYTLIKTVMDGEE